jgi:hypothetical protein
VQSKKQKATSGVAGFFGGYRTDAGRFYHGGLYCLLFVSIVWIMPHKRAGLPDTWQICATGTLRHTQEMARISLLVQSVAQLGTMSIAVMDRIRSFCFRVECMFRMIWTHSQGLPHNHQIIGAAVVRLPAQSSRNTLCCCCCCWVCCEGGAVADDPQVMLPAHITAAR